MQPIPFTADMALVFSVIGVVIFLFLTEIIRVDVVAILVMVALPLLGLIDGREAFNGLASNAVVSIIAVIIMGRGLDHTGIISRAVRPLVKLAGNSRRRIIALLSVTVAVISSFMQNVGAAALFLPALQRLSRTTGIHISQLLMPVGFSAILGGTVTLVGSSPLIMLNDLIRPFNLAPFNLFSVAPVGLALVGSGILYFMFLGNRLLPGGKGTATTQALTRPNPLDYYPEVSRIFELRAPEDGGNEVRVVDLCSTCNVHVVALSPDGRHDKIIPPDRDMVIPRGAVFVVYGDREAVKGVAAEHGYAIRSELTLFAEDMTDDLGGVVEAVVPPHSSFVGRTMADIRLRHNYRMTPLAMAHGEHVDYTRFGAKVLEPGDTILMYGPWESFHAMRHKRDLLFVQSLDHEVLHPKKARMAVTCFALSTLLVIFTSLPLSVSLMVGALGMILTRVLDIDEAYRGVDWRTVFLLAGLIPLGLALQKTNAASWLAANLLNLLGDPPPLLFLAVVGAISTAFTLLISNVGAAVLLVPLVVDMATDIGIDPRLAALTVAVAASNSFILPTHQVNALYMGPGGYGSRDFIKAGLPLTVIFLAVLTLFIGLLHI